MTQILPQWCPQRHPYIWQFLCINIHQHARSSPLRNMKKHFFKEALTPNFHNQLLHSLASMTSYLWSDCRCCCQLHRLCQGAQGSLSSRRREGGQTWCKSAAKTQNLGSWKFHRSFWKNSESLKSFLSQECCLQIRQFPVGINHLSLLPPQHRRLSRFDMSSVIWAKRLQNL